MMRIFIFALALALPIVARAQECTPEAAQRLQSLMVIVLSASQTVDAYKKKYRVDSQSREDLMAFCLDGKAASEFHGVFEQAASAVNDLEAFGNSQAGPCKDAALKASGDLENNVRKIMACRESCKQKFR